MNPQLRISVRLLVGRYHGDDWRPAPARLFQALVAGARTGCRVLDWQQARIALAWLEKQDPPGIVAPDTREGFAYKSFAPNNDSDARKVVALVQQGRALPDAMRVAGMITTKHHAPRLLDAGEGAAIHYLWPLPAPTAKEDWTQANQVCRLARNLLALGWGVDVAVGEGHILAGTAPLPAGRQHIPSWGGGPVLLKAPAPGLLDELERAHRAFRLRTLGEAVDADTRARAYRRVPYRLAGRAQGRLCVPFDLLDEEGEGRRAVRWEDGMLVSAWLRHAAKERFFVEGWERERVNGYVCGHTTKGEENRRLSFLPLPSIGHPHSDGHHRRALVVLPFNDENAEESMAILYRMAGDPLRALGQTQPVAWLGAGAPDPVVRRYLEESDEWLSATPVILHGRDHDGGRFRPRKAEKLILQAFAESGYPVEQIVEFSYQRAPYWRGPGGALQAGVPKHLTQWPRFHVWVRFRNPITGPLLVGIGRHYGLGVFASSPKSARRETPT